MDKTWGKVKLETKKSLETKKNTQENQTNKKS